MVSKLNISDDPNDPFARVDSKHIEEYIKVLKNNPNMGVSLSKTNGFSMKDLDFLREVPHIRSLGILDPVYDISPVLDLHNLEKLSFDKTSQEIDFSNWPKLESFRGLWSPKFINLGSLNNLKDLALWSYKPKSRDITELQAPKSIEQFELVQSTITSLKGIEEYSRIKSAEFHYLYKLQDIQALVGLRKSLTRVRFGSCKNIEQIESVGKLTNLIELGIDKCGEIPDISFIRTLKKLKLFSFVGTNVLDGDLSPCLSLPRLEHVGTFDKKHYSHKARDLPKFGKISKR